jgi:hypothetical protein
VYNKHLKIQNYKTWILCRFLASIFDLALLISAYRERYGEANKLSIWTSKVGDGQCKMIIEVKKLIIDRNERQAGQRVFLHFLQKYSINF